MSETSTQACFARRVRAARTALGLSQVELGKRMGLPDGVASTRINRYERGVHLPDLETARTLAAALEVPVAALLAEEDDLAVVAAGMGEMSDQERAQAVRAIKELLGQERTQKILAQLGLLE